MASWFDGRVVVVTSSSASECCSAACTGLRTWCTAVPTSASAAAAAETKSFSPFRIPRVQLNIKNCVIGTVLHPMVHSTALLQSDDELFSISSSAFNESTFVGIQLLTQFYVCLTSDSNRIIQDKRDDS